MRVISIKAFYTGVLTIHKCPVCNGVGKLQDNSCSVCEGEGVIIIQVEK